MLGGGGGESRDTCVITGNWRMEARLSAIHGDERRHDGGCVDAEAAP